MMGTFYWIYFHIFFRCVYTFSSPKISVLFNRQGTRLVGGRIKDPSLMIFDFPSSNGAVDAGSVRLSAQGFPPPIVGSNTFCFAGQEEDLVVAASETDCNLYVWSLPESQGKDLTVNQSLFILRGHTAEVYTVRCNNDMLLASAGAEKTIKLWKPFTL